MSLGIKTVNYASLMHGIPVIENPVVAQGRQQRELMMHLMSGEATFLALKKAVDDLVGGNLELRCAHRLAEFLHRSRVLPSVNYFLSRYTMGCGVLLS